MIERTAVKTEDIVECTPLVVAPLALPPPTNGQTVINASVVQRLRRMNVRLKLVDTSPRSQRRTILYHLRRLVSVSAIPAILAANVGRRRRRLYTVIESGLGILYNFVVVAFARLFGYELFLHHHTSNYAKAYKRRFASLCIVAGEQAIHIALSERMARDLKQLYGVQSVVVHNACHIEDPGTPAASSATSEVTIGFLSNLSLEKGLDTVLLSFEAIRAAGVRARLLLGGPILDEGAEALIREAHGKFGEDVVQLGPLAGAAKHAFFDAIDIFLFPSRYRMEAQPLVMLEALSYGVATLATPQGYSGEIVEPLGTATEASNFISFATEFARTWSQRPDFGEHHRMIARARFLELSDASNVQTIKLLQLLSDR